MTLPDFILANFTISFQAKRGIAIVRKAFDAHSSDPAAVVSVGWGILTMTDGRRFEQPVVSFYGESQIADVADMIQKVDGIDLVFFTTPTYARQFDDKALDFADERGFFLRS